MDLVCDKRGSGEPLVLLHGIGSRWQVFEPILDELARDFQVWSVDMPGFGASPAASPPITSIPDLAGRVAEWLREQALAWAASGVAGSAGGLAPIGFWSTRERIFTQASVRTTRTVSELAGRGARLFGANAVTRTLMLSQVVAKPWSLDPEAVAADVAA